MTGSDGRHDAQGRPTQAYLPRRLRRATRHAPRVGRSDQAAHARSPRLVPRALRRGRRARRGAGALRRRRRPSQRHRAGHRPQGKLQAVRQGQEHGDGGDAPAGGAAVGGNRDLGNRPRGVHHPARSRRAQPHRHGDDPQGPRRGRSSLHPRAGRVLHRRPGNADPYRPGLPARQVPTQRSRHQRRQLPGGRQRHHRALHQRRQRTVLHHRAAGAHRVRGHRETGAHARASRGLAETAGTHQHRATADLLHELHHRPAPCRRTRRPGAAAHHPARQRSDGNPCRCQLPSGVAVHPLRGMSQCVSGVPERGWTCLRLGL